MRNEERGLGRCDRRLAARRAGRLVEVHFDGEADPAPTAPEAWTGDERFEGGFWLLFDIDLSKLSNKSIRVNISLPEQPVHEIDEHARSRHMSRSALLAAPARKEMAAH